MSSSAKIPGNCSINIGDIQRKTSPQEGLIELAKLKLLAAKNSGCNGVNFLD
jgi:hypothetical protein